MVGVDKTGHDLAVMLAGAGLGRRVIRLAPKDAFFLQGDSADSVFYLQEGRAKITVVSVTGKEATIKMLFAGDFFGEGALAAMACKRPCSATALSTCTALKLSRGETIRLMRDERRFSEFFMKYLVESSVRLQADLVDQLFNSSEKRLARILLLMAEYGETGKPVELIPKISQETLAEMVGTTRSRVSFFMNRFRSLGFIEYKGRIRVHKSLLNVVQNDQIIEHDSRSQSLDLPIARST